ncbi:MAG: hypothetical protein PHT69_04765, partial [Bacteroidales bacterium]|nr:hypothetical protein [Bacteroidales bacterium]
MDKIKLLIYLRNSFLFLLLFIFQNKLISQNISGIINSYYPVYQIDYCANSAFVSNAAGLNVGDKVLIIQMQGAEIDTTNTISSGTILNIADAGNYEYAIIDDIIGNEVVFRDSLLNSYTPWAIDTLVIPPDTLWSNAVQIVSVPIYANATVTDTLKCAPWNGASGGILVFEVTGTLTLNAPINVSDRGFRGGEKIVLSGLCNTVEPDYVRGSMNLRHKGEGIANLRNEHWGGRGCVANGGGACGGQKVMAGQTDAWYMGGGGGGNGGVGGRGGKSSTFCAIRWDGGLGGKSIGGYMPTLNKIFMGGGGGVGHHRYTTTGPEFGTNGGGIVIIKANTLVGNNQNIFAYANDKTGLYTNVGRSGGGAGGTVLLHIQSYSGNVNVNLKGGKGGDNSGGSLVGPGGGGGGGVLWVSNAVIPANIIYDLSGGLNGVQLSYTDPWGAEPGSTGMAFTNLVLKQGNAEFVPVNLVTNASGNSPLCVGDSIFLQGGFIPGNTSYLWTGPNGFIDSTQNPVVPNVTTANSGAYGLSVIVGGCPGPPQTVNILVHPVPISPTVLDTFICFGDNVPTLVDTSNSSGIVTWYDDPSLTTPIHTGLSFTPTVPGPGTYTFYITHSQNNCPSFPDTAILIVHPIPSAPVSGGNQSVCFGSPVPSLSVSGTGLLQWYSDPGLDTLVYTGSTYSTGLAAVGVYTFYVTQTVNNCKSLATEITLTIKSIPSVQAISNISVCSGTTINIPPFVSVPPGGTFTWANSNTAIGIGISGTGNISSWTAPATAGASIIGTITVTPTLNGCSGTPTSFTVTIKPTPAVNAVSNISVCPGDLISIPAFVSVPSGATFGWGNTNTAIGLGVSGTGNISSWTAPATSIGITGTITVTPTLNSCPGTPTSFTVTIKPTPSVNAISNISVCPGDQISIPAFVSVPSGATFGWGNTNTAIGLGVSGTGNISSWTAPATSTGITGTITVTPTLNSCPGTPTSFTVTIKPTPSVNAVSNISVCPGDLISIPAFVSVPSGATFDWGNSNAAIGLGVSGTGNISSWTAPATSTVITGTITVTPTLNSCQGTPTSFTVTIKPTPSVNAVSNISVCPGDLISIPAFVSVPSGATFDWGNSNAAIGLGVSGIGNISSWTAPATSTGITGTITVTPTLNSCPGTPTSFTVTIKPTPSVNAVSNISVCP